MKSLRVFLLQGNVSKAKEHGENFVERARQLNTICTLYLCWFKML
ncbi:MAG: hypothetical protein ACK4VK_03445 [Aquificaceae bacterium]